MNIDEILYNLARKASKKGEIPVSAIIVKNNKIIAKAYNRKNKTKNILDHAEIIAIKKANKKLHKWNLSDCIMYVTLKPCSMCEQIINQTRISKIYYYLEKPDYKKEYSNVKYLKLDNLEFKSSYQQLLSDFFKKLR